MRQIIALLILIFMFAAMWKVYVKAGQPGWGCIIPIYNAYLLCIIGGKPGWWVLLMFIPVVNIVVSALVSIGVAEQFGKDAGFGIGLWLLGVIFFPILGFGSATYGGPVAIAAPAPAMAPPMPQPTGQDEPLQPPPAQPGQ